MSTSRDQIIPYAVHIPRARFTAFLVVVVLVLLANHIMLQIFHYQWDAGHWLLRDMFDVDEEENFPTYYSSFALLVCSALLYAIACHKSQLRDRFAKHWLILSFGFLILSADEVAGMHEALNTVTDFPWTVPAVVVVAVAAVTYVPFLIHLPKTTRNGFLIAGMLFAGGAIGVEHAGGWLEVGRDLDSLGYNLLTALEEGMEMFGVIFMINTLLGYMESGDSVAVQVIVDNDE